MVRITVLLLMLLVPCQVDAGSFGAVGSEAELGSVKAQLEHQVNVANQYRTRAPYRGIMVFCVCADNRDVIIYQTTMSTSSDIAGDISVRLLELAERKCGGCASSNPAVVFVGR